MLRAAAIFTLCEKLWTVCACLNLYEKWPQFSYGETLFFHNLELR